MRTVSLYCILALSFFAGYCELENGIKAGDLCDYYAVPKRFMIKNGESGCFECDAGYYWNQHKKRCSLCTGYLTSCEPNIMLWACDTPRSNCNDDATSKAPTTDAVYSHSTPKQDETSGLRTDATNSASPVFIALTNTTSLPQAESLPATETSGTKQEFGNTTSVKMDDIPTSEKSLTRVLVEMAVVLIIAIIGFVCFAACKCFLDKRSDMQEEHRGARLLHV